VKVHHIIFIIWGIVFAYWLVGQFGRYNKNKETRRS
jgi:hypothetical protein